MTWSRCARSIGGGGLRPLGCSRDVFRAWRDEGPAPSSVAPHKSEIRARDLKGGGSIPWVQVTRGSYVVSSGSGVRERLEVQDKLRAVRAAEYRTSFVGRGGALKCTAHLRVSRLISPRDGQLSDTRGLPTQWVCQLNRRYHTIVHRPQGRDCARFEARTTCHDYSSLTGSCRALTTTLTTSSSRQPIKYYSRYYESTLLVFTSSRRRQPRA
jgi:hypothetical protein